MHLRIEEALIRVLRQFLQILRNSLILVAGTLKLYDTDLKSDVPQLERGHTRLLKPPPEKNTPVSGISIVPPTEVTLIPRSRCQ